MVFLSRYYYRVFKKTLKKCPKTAKNHIKKLFSKKRFSLLYEEQLWQQNAQKINLNRILGLMYTLSESEKIKREDNIIKDTKNLFRLRKQIDKRNLFRLIKENETIKDKIIRDIKIPLEKEDDYYKPMKVGNFWNNNYIEYESNGDKKKYLSVK